MRCRGGPTWVGGAAAMSGGKYLERQGHSSERAIVQIPPGPRLQCRACSVIGIGRRLIPWRPYGVGSRPGPRGRGEGARQGLAELYDWLIDRDILIVRAERSEPLVVLPLKLAAEIAAKAVDNECRSYWNCPQGAPQRQWLAGPLPLPQPRQGSRRSIPVAVGRGW